jgi:hypothetical protein
VYTTGTLAGSARQAEWGAPKVHRPLSLWVFGDVIYAVLPLPPGDEDFAHRWRVINPMVAQRCQTRLKRPEWMNARRRKRNQRTLWQHRFWEHLIRDEADFNRHIDYIHWHPVTQWVRGTGGPLAVFELPSVCQTVGGDRGAPRGSCVSLGPGTALGLVPASTTRIEIPIVYP